MKNINFQHWRKNGPCMKIA